MKVINQEVQEDNGKLVIIQTTQQEVTEQDLLNQLMDKRRQKADIIRRMEELKSAHLKLSEEELDIKKMIDMIVPQELPTL